MTSLRKEISNIHNICANGCNFLHHSVPGYLKRLKCESWKRRSCLSATRVCHNTPLVLLHGFCQNLRTFAKELSIGHSTFSGDKNMQKYPESN
jgi:hypothetical protein